MTGNTGINCAPPGSVIVLFTRSATRSNGCFGDSKDLRRIFSRFEKLNVVFLAFLCFALIVEALRSV